MHACKTPATAIIDSKLQRCLSQGVQNLHNFTPALIRDIIIQVRYIDFIQIFGA